MEEVPRQPPFLKTATFLPLPLMNLAPKDLISPSHTAALPPGNCGVTEDTSGQEQSARSCFGNLFAAIEL